MPSPLQTPTFEAKLARIDAIVKALESGTEELARATELFREGKALAHECDAQLKTAQAEIDRAMEPSQDQKNDDDTIPF